jgi:RNA polymerase sigma-70 factor (ECF subfamily)
VTVTRPSGESSFSLLRRAKAGEPGALDALVGRYLTPLRRWARGRLPRWARDGMDTEDLVQDSVINSLRHLDTFDAKRQGALQAYLRQAIVNRIRDEVRRVQRRPQAAPLESGIVDAAASPLDEAIGADIQERYERALASLDDHERALVIARIELGYSYSQIAVALDKPSADAARMAVGRVLVKLSAAMSGT